MHSLIKKYCSKEWQEYIDFHAKIITKNPGEPVFTFDDNTEGLFLVNRGNFKIISRSNDNKERIIRLASDGDILGHRGFGGNWTYAITAIALTEAELTFIPLSVFNDIVRANSELGYYMMIFFAEELRKAEQLSHLTPVLNTVASVIYECYEIFGLEKGSKSKLDFTLSRKDIANRAATTYESVVRALSELNKTGVIQIEGKSIHIMNFNELDQIRRHS